jgi:hypothetical protein
MASGGAGAVAAHEIDPARQAVPADVKPSGTNVNDLLQRFAEARDRMKSFVIVGRGVRTFSYPFMKWSGTAYTREEYRSDGKRSQDTECIWGNVSMINPAVKENQAQYRSMLWDGEYEYYHHKADPPRPGGVQLVHRDDPRRDKASDGSANFIRRGAVGEIMGYHWADDGVRLDELLKTSATQLSLRGQTDLIRGVNCHVIDAVIGEHGKYTIWIDPVHDYQIARIQVRRGPGDHIMKHEMPGDEHQSETVELSGFEKVGEIWFPKEYVLTIKTDSNTRHSTEERHVRFTKVVFNPDHEALKSFVPEDIANGTPVRFRDLPPSRSFVWQDGRVVDQAGQVRFDSRHK